MIAVITFANAAMLAGLGAVALPLAIHVLTQGQPHDLTFPTIRFLRQAAASQSRLRRLRHWILLALRTLAIVLLVLAFARPRWFTSADAAQTSDRDTVAVVLLDTSASMGYTTDSGSTLHAAVARAATILNALEPARGDRANIILIDAVPEAFLTRPTNNLASLTTRLRAVRPTAEPAAVLAALNLAGAQLEPFPTSRRELHLVSDFQRTNWQTVDFRGLPRGTHVLFHPIGLDRERPNAWVKAVRCEPPRPTRAQPCRLVVELANDSAAPVRRDVSIRINGEPHAKHTNVELPVAAPAAVAFDLRFNEPGVYEIEAEIPADGLTVDDRHYAVVRVVDRLPVVLCTDDDLRSGATSGYYVWRALAPYADGSDALDVRVVPGYDLSEATLAGVDVAVLDAANALSQRSVAALLGFLERGGGALVLLGPGARAENLARLGTLAQDDTAPWELATARVDAPARAETAHVVGSPQTAAESWHPFLAAAAQSLSAINARQYHRVFPQPQRMHILARYQDDTTAIATAAIGKGRLLICNIGVDARWSDFARHAAFPAVLHEIVRALRPAAALEPAAIVGRGTTLRWSAPEQLSGLAVTDPDGKPLRVAVRREGPTAVVDLPSLQSVGFHRVRVGDSVVAAVGVNVDPDESDLTPASIPQIEQAASAQRTIVAAASDAAAGRKPVALWPWVVGAALCVLAVELIAIAAWRT
jgi:hypothetical protein